MGWQPGGHVSLVANNEQYLPVGGSAKPHCDWLALLMLGSGVDTG